MLSSEPVKRQNAPDEPFLFRKPPTATVWISMQIKEFGIEAEASIVPRTFISAYLSWQHPGRDLPVCFPQRTSNGFEGSLPLRESFDWLRLRLGSAHTSA